MEVEILVFNLRSAVVCCHLPSVICGVCRGVCPLSSVLLKSSIRSISVRKNKYYLNMQILGAK